MTGEGVAWFAIAIEIVGLSLIAIELYLPRSKERISQALTSSTEGEPSPAVSRASAIMVGTLAAVWIGGAVGVAIVDVSLTIAFNVGMTVFVLTVALVSTVIGRMVRLGVLLGRGNTLGGVGLVLALLGFALELVQLL